MIKDKVRGFRTTDGAGVNFIGVLGKTTVKTYDPILIIGSLKNLENL